MKLKLYYSTCPNDVFMFSPLVEGWIDTGGLEFEPFLYDIEELNNFMLQETPDIGKFSYALLPKIEHNYILLKSGSALGEKVGPLLIANKNYSYGELKKLTIAIPGKYTTANLLLHYYLGDVKTSELLFSEILPAVSSGKFPAGVIIHEGRFVYENYKVKLLQDLGEYWQEKTNLPIPLGGIAIHKRHKNIAKTFENLLRKSIEYAFENKQQVFPLLKKYAQELSKEVIWKHVYTYVNKYSLDLGEEGIKAVEIMRGISGGF